MANTGSSTNIGSQQVSIYPYQELKSVYGNEILYNIMEPGVYYSNIYLQNSPDLSSINICVGVGTTMLFNRVDASNNLFVGKVVLGADGVVATIKKTDFWRDSSIYINAKKIFLVADWAYDVTNPTNIYVAFSIVSDANIATIKADDGTTDHKLILGSWLNHQYYVQNYNITHPLTYYHTSYDYQSGRNTLKKLFNETNKFMIDFDPTGRGLYIDTGDTLVGGTFINQATMYPEAYSPTSTAFRPAVNPGIYCANYRANTWTSIVGSEALYYQVDFLRLKFNNNTKSYQIAWESFVKPINGYTYNSAVLDFTNYSNINKASIEGFLRQFTFNIIDDGITLLVSLRPSSGIPYSDGATNLLWPQNCVMMRESTNPALQVGSVHETTRMKVPVYLSSDLTE